MILPCQDLRSLMVGQNPVIKLVGDRGHDLVQPASLDLPIGSKVYRMAASALPREGQSIVDLIEQFQLYDFDIQPEGSVFEKDACYLVPLDVELSLPNNWSAIFSPKSTVGRNDIFVRVLSDGQQRYDKVSGGYCGRLFLEIIPLSFTVRLFAGDTLTQMRIRTDSSSVSKDELLLLHSKYGLIRSNQGEIVSNQKVEINSRGTLYFHADLERQVVGFESVSNPTELVCPTKKDMHEPEHFWRTLVSRDGELVLEPGKFYLLATKERAIIPPEVCGEVVTYDVTSGEFRTHYAGFFDNGFGGEVGTNAVLEVRVRDVPFRLYDGQPICGMRFFRTLSVPDKLYTGNYTQSGPSLGKNFLRRFDIWG